MKLFFGEINNGKAIINDEEQQQLQQQQPQRGLQQVGARAGQRDPDHVALGVAQPPEVDRHRFGIAEQEGPCGGEVQQQRHGDGAHRVDVAHRVERDAAQHGGGVVAVVARRVAMGRLVQGDGKQHGDGVDGHRLDDLGKVHALIVPGPGRPAGLGPPG